MTEFVVVAVRRLVVLVVLDTSSLKDFANEITVMVVVEQLVPLVTRAAMTPARLRLRKSFRVRRSKLVNTARLRQEWTPNDRVVTDVMADTSDTTLRRYLYGLSSAWRCRITVRPVDDVYMHCPPNISRASFHMEVVARRYYSKADDPRRPARDD